MKLTVSSYTLALAAFVSLHQAHGAGLTKEKIFYAFSGGNDGAQPNADLIKDADGNIYGTADAGGASGYGTVFKLTRAGALTVLHTFAGAPDGANPLGGLTRDNAGNLYGSTSRGGANDDGELFKLAPDGTLTTLYSFKDAKDGTGPIETMAIDAKNVLYGIAGGVGTFGGVAFKYDTVGGKFTTLHTFTGKQTDGGLPLSSLELSGDELYGNTYYGGTNGAGTVFKLSETGRFTLLHSFAVADGGYPNHSRMAIDSKGNLFGVTKDGGAAGCNCGVLFKMSPGGKFKVVHSFGANSSDGTYPFGGIYIDTSDNVYGTTAEGGTSNAGTAFEFTTQGAENTLSFPGTAGSFPQGDLTQIGNFLYGSTQLGGTARFGGIIFRLSR